MACSLTVLIHSLYFLYKHRNMFTNLQFTPKSQTISQPWPAVYIFVNMYIYMREICILMYVCEIKKHASAWDAKLNISKC